MVYELAQGAARRVKGANEIAVRGSVGPSGTAGEQAGFRMVQQDTVYLLNKKGNLVLPENFQFQMIDDDVFLLDVGSAFYYT
jgi:hypothetical protein